MWETIEAPSGVFSFEISFKMIGSISDDIMM